MMETITRALIICMELIVYGYAMLALAFLTYCIVESFKRVKEGECENGEENEEEET